MTDLWYGELYRLWSERAVPVAGLTAYAALFCLEQLAWDHRMRVIYRGAHTRRAGGQVEHVLAGPHEIIDAIRPAAASDWPAELGSIIARVESQGGWTGLPAASRTGERRFITHDAAPSAPLADGILGRDCGSTLHSWVIALPARA